MTAKWGDIMGVPSNGQNGGVSDSAGTRGCLATLGVLFLVIVVLFMGFLYVAYRAQNASSGNPSSGTVLSRAATVHDIAVDWEPNLSGLGARCIVRPAVNIVGLTLRVKVYDENGSELYSADKNLGTVKAGVSVDFTVSLADLGWSSLSAERVSVTVIGGRVSLLDQGR